MKNLRRYAYVGPDDIRRQVEGAPKGHTVACIGDLFDWMLLKNNDHESEFTVTFIIDLNGDLCIADRRSEHVACAGEEDVIAAGEMTFLLEGDVMSVETVTNQSTGYCPEPDSWPVVEMALDQLGITHPGRYTTEVTFRRCQSCGQINFSS